ncbi:MAG: glutathione S-transferase family protein, partial [Burkholderiales bacterium]
MELYHNNISVCAQKVRLVLHEKRLEPVEHNLNLTAGEHTRPEYLKLNPKGVVPTLVDHGQPIIESTVICEYLEDTYPDVPLRPEDTAARARMRLWTMLPDTGLHTACGVMSFAIAFRHRVLALPREERERWLSAKPDPKMRENASLTVEFGLDAPNGPGALRIDDKVLSQMSRQLDATCGLAGQEYSLADVA